MKPVQFQVNQRLDVMFDKTPFVERFPSKVEEVGPNNLVLAMPMSKGVPLLAAPGAPVYGRVIDAGVVWLFTSYFLAKRFEPVAVWVVAPPDAFERIQLRAYVRLETALAATVRLAGAPATPAKAITKDIGGGGAQLVTKLAVEPGKPVELSVDLQEGGLLKAAGEVVRAEYDEKREFYTVAIKFVEIPERERDKIIKYIFKKQLKRRHSGLDK